SIGRLAAPVDISITDIQNGTLTDEQAAALALAAAPGDVTLVGTLLGLPIEFSFTGSFPLGFALTGLRVKQLAPLFVNATGNFGTLAQFVTILMPTPSGRLYADAGNNVFVDGATGTLTNPNGDLNVSHVYSSGGNVTLHADGSILNPDATTTASVHGNTLSFQTLNGSVGVVGGDLLVDSAFSGAGTVNTDVTGGDVYLIETLGNLSLGTNTVHT